MGRWVGSPGSRRPLPLLRFIPRAPTSAFRGLSSQGGGAVSLLSGRGLGWPGAAPAHAALALLWNRVCGQRPARAGLSPAAAPQTFYAPGVRSSPR